MIESLTMRTWTMAVFLLVPVVAGGAERGKVSGGLERLLYVTDRSGVSVYDINDSHKLLRKIEVPDTGDYKGISASVQLGKLYPDVLREGRTGVHRPGDGEGALAPALQRRIRR